MVSKRSFIYTLMNPSLCKEDFLLSVGEHQVRKRSRISPTNISWDLLHIALHEFSLVNWWESTKAFSIIHEIMVGSFSVAVKCEIYLTS